MAGTGERLLPEKGLGVGRHAREVIGDHEDLHHRLVGVEECLQEERGEHE